MDHFYKAFLEPSWSHLESRLGSPGALLRGLMFQKHYKNQVKNACAQKRVLATGDLPWATFQSHFGSILAAFELQNYAKITKKRVQKISQILMSFWTSFGLVLEPHLAPKATPESTQKLDQNWTKKGAPKGEAPKIAQSQGLGSNLVYLSHPKIFWSPVKPSLSS